jgi:phage terminase large subunit-like protein
MKSLIPIRGGSATPSSDLAVETDAAGNLKPSKKKSTERIDGIVAGVMALGRALVQPAQSASAYETRGMIVLDY